MANPRDASIQIKPTLGPEVCKLYLHWAIWIPGERVWKTLFPSCLDSSGSLMYTWQSGVPIDERLRFVFGFHGVIVLSCTEIPDPSQHRAYSQRFRACCPCQNALFSEYIERSGGNFRCNNSACAHTRTLAQDMCPRISDKKQGPHIGTMLKAQPQPPKQ